MRTSHLVIRDVHLRLLDASSEDSAVISVSRGMLVLENCKLEGSESTSACLLVEGAASHVVVRSCSFLGSARGLWFRDNSRGEVEECQIYKVQEVGVKLQGQSSPVFTNCTISESRENGVSVHDGGKGRFENCQISSKRIEAGCNPSGLGDNNSSALLLNADHGDKCDNEEEFYLDFEEDDEDFEDD